MTVDGIDAEVDHLVVPLTEFGFEFGHQAKFGGAYQREIFRMGKKHASVIDQPVIKPDLALCGLGGEVRRGTADLQRRAILHFCELVVLKIGLGFVEMAKRRLTVQNFKHSRCRLNAADHTSVNFIDGMR